MTFDLSNIDPAQLSDVVSHLPEPVQRGFAHVGQRFFGRLFGRIFRARDDTARARSIAAEGLANALVEQIKNEPATMKAVAELYMPDELRKLMNKAEVLKEAEEEVIAKGHSADANVPPPDDDWINAFIRAAEDASSERLQHFLGKMLAGEIAAPGAFSKSTIRLLSEMDLETARAFEELCHRRFEEAYIYRSPEFDRGTLWTQLNVIREAGLASPTDAAQFAPDASRGIWFIGEKPQLWVDPGEQRAISIPIAKLTKEGAQLSRLLPSATDYAVTLRGIAIYLERYQPKSIVLAKGGAPEFLWPKA